MAIGLIIFGTYDSFANDSSNPFDGAKVGVVQSVKQEDLFIMLKDTNSMIGQLFGDLFNTHKNFNTYKKKNEILKEATEGMTKFFKTFNSALDKVKKSKKREKKTEELEDIDAESRAIFEKDYKIGFISDEVGPGWRLKNLSLYLSSFKEIEILFKIVNYLNLLKNELEKCAMNSDGKYITSEQAKYLAETYEELARQIDGIVTEYALSNLSDEEFNEVSKLMSPSRRESYNTEKEKSRNFQKITSDTSSKLSVSKKEEIIKFPADPAPNETSFNDIPVNGAAKPDYINSFPAE